MRLSLLLTILFGMMIESAVVAWEDSSPKKSHRSVSGIYPHLAVWNKGGECGIGGVYPHAGKLWLITYSPHRPNGSDDKLYSVDPELQIEAFAGSVGGTPANRMLHKESGKLIIGPYFVDREGQVEVISPEKMVGRHTGNARHLFDPENKVYFATMEEGFYEVDVNTLEVKELFADYQKQTGYSGSNQDNERKAIANLPGYHGKGLYSGQGRLIYANNGEASPQAMQDPTTTAGCLAEWDGKSQTWKVVRRNQFLDVRGPGGLAGNADPENDPIWAIGWDHRSLILMLLDGGKWYTYRLPKATHTYDGAHGWNTEWPRFNDLGEENMVLNAHGMFWNFPRTFSRANSAGIFPRSTYLKVVGDYCRWGEHVVFGCDDTARNEFLNKRKAKGNIEPPGQSHSNLWFTKPGIFDHLGTPIGRGGFWVDDVVKSGQPSDPYLFTGFKRRLLSLSNLGESENEFLVELDLAGTNAWTKLNVIKLAAGESHWHTFESDQEGVWIRVTPRNDGKATAYLQYSDEDQRQTNPELFRAVAQSDSSELSCGTIRVRGKGKKTLAFASRTIRKNNVSAPAFYELDGELRLRKNDNASDLKWTSEKSAIATGVLESDDASAIYVDDNGQRWRLPKGKVGYDKDGLMGPERVDREVVTERDLFNCHGIFYELPARNAGGVAKIRPICTHNKRINDYCSYRGMLVMSGIDLVQVSDDDEHVVVSEDGNAALWLGVVDDLWKLGKPTGVGGPWNKSTVQAGEPSDPYLLTGFDEKTLVMHQSGQPEVNVTVEIDVTGAGNWTEYKVFSVKNNKEVEYKFPNDVTGYWMRIKSDKATQASAILQYK